MNLPTLHLVHFAFETTTDLLRSYTSDFSWNTSYKRAQR